MSQAATDEAPALVREARAHRDAARAVLDEAAAHAHLVIGAAELQAVRFEEIEEQWQKEEQEIAARHRAQLEELERLESRLQEVRGSLEGRAMAISEDAELRSELLIEHASSTESELRDEAHQALVDIVTRSAQVSAAQVFAAATPPEPTSEPRPERAAVATPAHLADSAGKGRFWRRRARASSAHRAGT